MASGYRLHGGVIVNPDGRTHGIIRLLSLHVRGKIDLAYYDHPHQIETGRGYQFIIVLSKEDLRSVLRLYTVVNLPVPLIVHLDRPEVIGATVYAREFPGVEVVPVEQASLGDKDVTLQIGIFQEIIEALEARC